MVARPRLSDKTYEKIKSLKKDYIELEKKGEVSEFEKEQFRNKNGSINTTHLIKRALQQVDAEDLV